MNKEKYINKLNEELEELKGKERLSFEIHDSIQEAQYTSRIFGVQYALNLASLLDEPQKVKVPAFVAEWIKKHSYMGKYVCLERFMCQYNDVELPTDLYNYYDRDKDGSRDKIISAILGDYEVEEEPKWVVKVGNLYFCGWEDTTAQFVMNTVLGEDESIIKYKNEGTASSVAKNLGGTAEKA